ncbi:MAG: universal stress protein [Planctomycetaceae bacterium]|nr:universal stress protein [Planctomycetaceae bacterium]
MGFLPRRRVLVPYDFSTESHEAMKLGHQLVDDPSHLHVIHVLPELTATEPGVIWATVDDASRMTHAREAIDERLKEYPRTNVNVNFGDPGHVITELAAEIECDLIVIPSHGRRGVQRILLGSVAERVVRLAHCPVLVMRK